MLEKSNFDEKQYRFDLICAYECGRNSVAEKTGRWIRWYEVIESADGKSTDHIPHCKCSECNCEYDTYSAQFIKYCRNCGAKMEVDV